jgi:signal transduction histidine kinase
MKHPPAGFSQQYRQALRDHLAQSSVPDQELISKISAEIRSAGFPILELAKLHERFLVLDLLPGCTVRKQTTIIRKAGNFFAAVLAADGAGHAGTRDGARLKKTIQSLSGRTVELATANQRLGLEIAQRKKVEAALRKSEEHGLKALEKSEALKEELRGLSRQILSIQEEERKKISRELHDVVAQALMGINVRLAALKTGAGMDARELGRNISLTQKMVKKSANIVHQYARELRPAALDDLGLIPALHSFMKSFTSRTGIRTHLTAFEEVEKLNSAKRTALYRVAQEALTNVARHAHASRVEVTLTKEVKFVRMEVRDDGKSFQIEPVLLSRGTKHLGLLGMRERVEMVGGRFEIESTPGKGSTIIARIPIGRSNHQKPSSNPMNDPKR